MKSRVDVDAVTSRALQYWMQDGLVELMFGLMMAFASGVPLVARALPTGSLRDFMYTFGNQALSVVSIYSSTWGLKKLKEWITFPRCGYVAFPKPSRKRRTTKVALMLLAVVVMALAIPLLAGTYADWINRAATPVFAIFFAACLLGGGLQYNQPTMLWEAFLTLLFAALLGLFTNLRGGQGFEVLTAMVGASMAIIGAFRLRGYLRANPRRQETEA
jgi:hypothetical protein